MMQNDEAKQRKDEMEKGARAKINQRTVLLLIMMMPADYEG